MGCYEIRGVNFFACCIMDDLDDVDWIFLYRIDKWLGYRDRPSGVTYRAEMQQQVNELILRWLQYREQRAIIKGI